jgi:hypothetical protein
MSTPRDGGEEGKTRAREAEGEIAGVIGAMGSLVNERGTENVGKRSERVGGSVSRWSTLWSVRRQ